MVRAVAPRIATLVAGLAGAGLLGCGDAGGAADTGPPPNVVLISLDTVRADHLSCYGYPRPTTPNLDALAAGATRYDPCQATAPWTVPAHASMFTGRFPFQHGAHSFRPVRRDRDNVHPLDRDQVTLAEALQNAGFRTAAFVTNNAYLDRRLQLDQGFQTYEVVDDPVRPAPWTSVNPRALAFLEGPHPRPFFLFLNYMDAHRPYNVRPASDALPDAPADPERPLLTQLKHHVMGGQQPFPTELREQVIAQYDMAIANLDVAVGQVVDRLRELGLYDDTVIVVTSDHGEYFGEHELVEHSKDVYQGALRVPLIVKGRRQAEGRVVTVPTSLVDVPGLVVNELPGSLRGRLEPLFPYGPGARPVLSENYFARLHDFFHETWGPRFDRVRRTLIDGRWKVIESSDGAHELYDLEADPDETTNLAEREPEVLARLLDELAAFRADAPAPTRAPGASGGRELTEEDLRQLQHLGY